MKKLISVDKIKDVDIENSAKEFIDIWEKYIKREGSKELLEYLKKSDFFKAPASTQYHSNINGGLCFHSLMVYKMLINELKSAGVELTDKVMESAAIAALGHDLCKVSFYKYGTRNVKKDLGNGKYEWITVPTYFIEEALPFGHGEKSVYIIQSFMNLTREEALAIRWHMGDFNEAYGGCSKAFSMCPFALYLHIADLKAANLTENTYDYENKCWKD